MHKSVIRIAGIAAAIGLLAGCHSSKKEDFSPNAAVILDASSFVVAKNGTAPDPANVLYSVQIVGVKSKCDYEKKPRTADTSLTITFRATRSPTGDSPQYSAPYFVGVTEGADRVINRKTYVVPFQFAPGESTVTFTDDVGSIFITP